MKVLDHLFAPAKPEGMDLELSPIAFGAWGGMFVTMINLLPVGQLDGGHVAYALFGPKQDRYAQLIHRSMLAFFFVVVFGHVARDLSGGLGLYYLGRHLANSLFWLVWFQVLAILGLLASRGRGDEPKPETLTVRMRLAATVGLVVHRERRARQPLTAPAPRLLRRASRCWSRWRSKVECCGAMICWITQPREPLPSIAHARSSPCSRSWSSRSSSCPSRSRCEDACPQAESSARQDSAREACVQYLRGTRRRGRITACLAVPCSLAALAGLFAVAACSSADPSTFGKGTKKANRHRLAGHVRHR